MRAFYCRYVCGIITHTRSRTHTLTHTLLMPMTVNMERAVVEETEWERRCCCVRTCERACAWEWERWKGAGNLPFSLSLSLSLSLPIHTHEHTHTHSLSKRTAHMFHIFIHVEECSIEEKSAKKRWVCWLNTSKGTLTSTYYAEEKKEIGPRHEKATFDSSIDT